MTSKSLFVKLQKEDCKRRIWALALISLVFLFVLPIYCALSLDNYDILDQYTKQEIMNLLGATNYALTTLTVLSAIVCGLGGFFYLQSRKKVDFYHSIPVRRETMFAVSYINGLLIYLVPYLFNLILSIIILSLNHIMFIEVLTSAFLALAINLLFYCLIYTITIIAVMLTGNIIVSGLGTAVFMFYAMGLSEIVNTYFNMYFQTYYDNGKITDLFSALSPILSYGNVISAFENGEDYMFGIIRTIIALLILIVIAVFLYRKRPSEAAQSAMAFEITKPILFFLLVIPIALGGGIVFSDIASNHRMGWTLFGIVLALIIFGAFIRIIYDFNIRSAFYQKGQLLACTIITGIIFCVFRFDILGYDTYIPKMSKIESMGVWISGLDQNLTYFDIDDDPENNIIRYIPVEYQLDNLKLKEFSPAYALSQIGIENPNNKRNWEYDGYDNDGYSNYIVKYTLKNGRKVYREYSIALSESTQYLKQIYENAAYKKSHFPLYLWNEDALKGIMVNYGQNLMNYSGDTSDLDENNIFRREINSSESKKLLQIYKEELLELSWNETALTNPVAELIFDLKHKTASGYYVYPSFTKTIAFLNEHGFDTEKSINTKVITSIRVDNQNSNISSDISNNNTQASEIVHSVNYTDKKKISEILPTLVDRELCENNSTVKQIEEGFTIIVNYKTDDNDIGQDFYYYFIKDKMPEFVKEDLKLNSK